MGKVVKGLSGAVTLLLLGACQDQHHAAMAMAPTSTAPAAVAAPTAAPSVPMAFKLRGSCTLKPDQVVRLKAQIGGEVKTVLMRRGDSVRRGAILATIDVEPLNLRRERAQIELERLVQRAELLRFQVAKADKEFTVVRDLAGSNGNGARFGREMATLMERRIELKDNELNQALTKLDLRVLDDQIRKSAIRAPFDGVILSRSVEPGAVVGSGIESVAGSEVLFEVADPSHLSAYCIVKEADAAQLITGAKATVQVDGVKSAPMAGKVQSISPVISNESGLSRREFVVDFGSNLAAHLLPGMNATVEIDSP